ncbi:hypothetical protein CVT25_008599 [Psilocybe cyanescens]|uniref:Uncharacterized protein n=1 Tax=Psilocybe cyanescens TaxID=93625 RepID=A0A409XNI6_PSICY|nr:hypothetical protein CVT25_008599 [Psilocybe cyanescens]
MKPVVGWDTLDEIQSLSLLLPQYQYPLYPLHTNTFTQGVRHKLVALETFLEINPSFQNRVVLIQIALHTSSPNETLASSSGGSFTNIISRINAHFSPLTYTPIVFLHTGDLTFTDWDRVSQGVEPADGEATGEDGLTEGGRHGVLVLSDFTGRYSYNGFRNCIGVNPWDDLHNHITTQTAHTFLNSFLNRSVRSNMDHPASLLDDVESRATLERAGGETQTLEEEDDPGRFEGTLWRDLLRATVFGDLDAPSSTAPAGTAIPAHAPLPEEVEKAVGVLGKLAEDRKNKVWLLSGLKVAGGLVAVTGRVLRVAIVAENGCFIKTRGVGLVSGEWINMVSKFNLTRKGSCLEILNYFTERTPGSLIEERQASMVWQYWTGPSSSTSSSEDPGRQWAQRQAAEVQSYIFDSLGERYGLRIIPGRNSFLVLPNNVLHSTAVGAILHWGCAPMHPTSDSDSGLAHGSFGSDGGSALAADASENSIHGGNGDGAGGLDVDFLLAVSSDEKLLRMLNEFDGAETVSTSGKGMDAKRRLKSEKSVLVEQLCGCLKLMRC